MAFQFIRDIVPGNALQIRRRVANPAKTAPVTMVVLHVLDSQGNRITKKEVKARTSRIHPPHDDGYISDQGNTEPHVVGFNINLFADETALMRTNCPYEIEVRTGSSSHVVEQGLIVTEGVLRSPPTESLNQIRPVPEQFLVSPPSGMPSPPPSPPPPIPGPMPGGSGYTSDTAYATYADAVETVGGRTALIIDGFLDASLGDYRQLKVWDEHARRMGNDPLNLKLTYEYCNRYTVPEVFDGNNNMVSSSNVEFNFREGIFRVKGDDTKQDYFCTYTFNFFPEPILRMFVEMTVSELNFVGVGAGGGYITNYTSVDSTPESYNGIIAVGALAKAWRRLATNSVLWRNWLIFDGDVGEGIQPPGGQSAMQAANEAANSYQTWFETLGAATKFDKFIAYPTEIYEVFANTGFGRYGIMGTTNTVIGGKFRGMTINKMGTY